MLVAAPREVTAAKMHSRRFPQVAERLTWSSSHCVVVDMHRDRVVIEQWGLFSLGPRLVQLRAAYLCVFNCRLGRGK